MALNDFLAEAAIMKDLKHPNLVQLLGKAIFLATMLIKVHTFVERAQKSDSHYGNR